MGYLICMLDRRRRRYLFIISLLFSAGFAQAADPLHVLLSGSLPAPPSLSARSAILLEALTGVILFEKNADDPIPPASLTKLMTLDIALQRIDEGLLDPSQIVEPRSDAWARNMPPRSSVMFLGPNQRLTIDDLLRGLVVDSANDAAVELADVIGGSVPAFVQIMNEEASQMGYRVMHFVDSSGISAGNLITAREYADFCRRFVALHPQALKSLFSLGQFTYPREENLSGDNRQKPVTQRNTDRLLGRYEGADGLKTGYIDESGYNFAATATRGQMRLISVVLGIHDSDPADGVRLRAVESEKLLDYGFGNFRLMVPTYAAPFPVRVWKGRARVLTIATLTKPYIVVPRDQAGSVSATVEQQREVFAPVSQGQVLGQLIVRLGDVELVRFPLQALTSVEKGGPLRRMLDSLILLFHRT